MVAQNFACSLDGEGKGASATFLENDQIMFLLDLGPLGWGVGLPCTKIKFFEIFSLAELPLTVNEFLSGLCRILDIFSRRSLGWVIKKNLKNRLLFNRFDQSFKAIVEPAHECI